MVHDRLDHDDIFNHGGYTKQIICAVVEVLVQPIVRIVSFFEGASINDVQRHCCTDIALDHAK